MTVTWIGEVGEMDRLSLRCVLEVQLGDRFNEED